MRTRVAIRNKYGALAAPVIAHLLGKNARNGRTADRAQTLLRQRIRELEADVARLRRQLGLLP